MVLLGLTHLCSQEFVDSIFKRQNVIKNKTVYSFVYFSVQEFLAAVHALHCFSKMNSLEKISNQVNLVPLLKNAF